MGKRESNKRHGYIRIRGVQRSDVDVRKLGKAVIALAAAQAEADAEADHRRKCKKKAANS